MLVFCTKRKSNSPPNLLEPGSADRGEGISELRHLGWWAAGFETAWLMVPNQTEVRVKDWLHCETGRGRRPVVD